MMHMHGGWVVISPPLILERKIAKFKRLREAKPSGLEGFDMDTATAMASMIGDGAVESDGCSSIGMLVSPTMPVDMKTLCKCTAMEDGTTPGRIRKDQRSMNSLTPIEATSVFTLLNRPQYNR